MIKLSVFGKTAIFLGNGRTISELFAKRSSEFSDRPVLTFAGELYVLDAAIEEGKTPELVFKVVDSTICILPHNLAQNLSNRGSS